MKLTVQDLLGDYRVASPEEVLAAAGKIIAHRYRRGTFLSSASASKDYFQHRLSLRNQEVFAALFLDNRHRIILYEELFFGTIDSASVHPRIVAQKALKINAAAVIVAHNHPSGSSEPSQADKNLTYRLREALALVEVRLLDHIIVGEDCTSLSENGLM